MISALQTQQAVLVVLQAQPQVGQPSASVAAPHLHASQHAADVGTSRAPTSQAGFN
jgi:hypothetical protein